MGVSRIARNSRFSHPPFSFSLSLVFRLFLPCSFLRAAVRHDSETLVGLLVVRIFLTSFFLVLDRFHEMCWRPGLLIVRGEELVV